MNLAQEILRSNNKAQKDKIVSYIGNDKERFAELVTAFSNGPYRITQRAAWPLSYCIEKHPRLLKPHFTTLFKMLDKEASHDAVRRNIFRLLQFVSIPKRHQARVWNLGMKYFTDLRQPIAIRVFAMTVLTQLALKNPALKNELVPLIEDQLPFASAGFLSRSKKLLKDLKH